jgi:hypothetical protein
MLIIAKKKDYYDGVVGSTGIDKTIVYDRELIDIEYNKIPELFTKKTNSWKTTNLFDELSGSIKPEYLDIYHSYSYFIVGFCGKLYIGWKLYTEKKVGILTELKTYISYDHDMVLPMIKSTWYSNRNFGEIYNKIISIDATEIFRKYKTPVFVYDTDYLRTAIGKYTRNRNDKFLVNPVLKDYEFYKVFDSFQALQEIQMYISGVLGVGENKMVEIEDKYKIQQYGFDKWSFRKEKELKKWKKIVN